ncbi:MAG: hypothetical protein QXT73_00395 [Candidatus Methanomethylicaceae archaeon]
MLIGRDDIKWLASVVKSSEKLGKEDLSYILPVKISKPQWAAGWWLAATDGFRAHFVKNLDEFETPISVNGKDLELKALDSWSEGVGKVNWEVAIPGDVEIKKFQFIKLNTDSSVDFRLSVCAAQIIRGINKSFGINLKYLNDILAAKGLGYAFSSPKPGGVIVFTDDVHKNLPFPSKHWGLLMPFRIF